jgi:putative ABC transport system substrate-binding protein
MADGKSAQSVRRRGDQTRRRELIAVLGAAVAWPLAISAEQSKVPTVGVLVVGAPGSEKFWRLFREAMHERGYVEGQTIRFEFRSDEGQVGRLPDLAVELVQLRPDVIVTWFTPAAIAAEQATREIPIVMAVAGDPVATGLAKSLSRPGGNVTGMSGTDAELFGKTVQFVRDMLPSAHRAAVLTNALDPFSKPFLEQIRLAGTATGIEIDAVLIHNPSELDAAFVSMEKKRPDAVIVQPSLPTKRAAQLALNNRLPAVCTLRSFVDEGGLMSYWFVEADLYDRAAGIVDKVLKGAKPADIPIEQPTKFEFVINLKTAKALGLTVPPTLLARADEVIE